MKNKEKIQILENRLNIHSELLERIISKLEFNDEPQLKQLDQSIFDGLDAKWRFAAVDEDKTACIYAEKPTIKNNKCFYHVDLEVIDGDYDASNWQNSLIERESKPQLKKLDHSVFNGLDSKWRYAAVDGSTSRAYVYEHRPHLYHGEDYWGIYVGLQRFIGEGFDASNWKEPLIERETNELTGSELCKAMLARGDKYVMCQCWCSSYADIEQVMDIVSGFAFEEGKKTFAGVSHNWDYAVPVNNQGEPLTSSDVGL